MMTKQKHFVKEVEDIVKRGGNVGRTYLPKTSSGKRVRTILVEYHRKGVYYVKRILKTLN